MKRFLPSGLMIFAGVLGIATASVHSSDQDVTKNRKKFDLREVILRKFLRDQHCPVQEFSEVFIAEADAHHLDWRLLPSLAFVESGGGRTARGNNLFGWANGKVSFNSIGESIHTVAANLAHGRPYRGKDITGKLLAYNQSPDYSDVVKSIMRQISPQAQVPAAE
jgi:hypothetical protein